MRMLKTMTLIFAIVNLVIGAAGFMSPLVKQTGWLRRRRNRSFFNTKPGLLFGFFGINWLHALEHLLHGVAGIVASTNYKTSRIYMWVTGIDFAIMSLIGWLTVGTKPGIHNVMGMALDWKGNVVHTLWSLFGFANALLQPAITLEDLTELGRETVEEFQYQVPV